MKIKPTIHVICITALTSCCLIMLGACNPLAYDPTTIPIIAMPPLPLQAPMLFGPQYDPYATMQSPGQFMMAPPYLPMPLDSMRRSNFGSQKSNKKNKERLTDEQKALGDLPVSFIDDEPSSISERISDSFSALGEGVKNHFRSITENFSDTLDDIKDAWRSPESSKKRG